MRAIDFHVHLSPDAVEGADLLALAARRAWGALAPRLPAGARAAVEVAAHALEPLRREARDRALDAVSQVMALSGNRASRLGAIGEALAARAGEALYASFLRATPENLLRAMDRAGVRAACVLPVAPLTTTEDALALCAAERLIPFCSVAPGTADVAARLAAWKGRGCRGVKVHPTLQDEPPESPFFDEVARAAGELSLPVVCHTGAIPLPGHPHGEYCAVERYAPLLRAHPRTRFVLAHMNLFRPDRALEVCRAHENAFLDTSWQPAETIARALERLGSSRLVFASDWPFLGAEPAAGIALVERACGGRADAIERVLYRNAAELLGIPA